MTASLLALAASVEAGEGPDRELDARIETLLRGGRAHSLGPEVVCRGLANLDTPRLTASVDAALALLREVLPGYVCEAKTWDIWSDGPYARVTPQHDDLMEIDGSHAPTLPRAIVAATLRAMAGRG